MVTLVQLDFRTLWFGKERGIPQVRYRFCDPFQYLGTWYLKSDICAQAILVKLTQVSRCDRSLLRSNRIGSYTTRWIEPRSAIAPLGLHLGLEVVWPECVWQQRGKRHDAGWHALTLVKDHLHLTKAWLELVENLATGTAR